MQLDAVMWPDAPWPVLRDEWQHAERLTDQAPHARLVMLEDGNHGCANRAPWHRPYTADWLAARLEADAWSE